MVLAQQAYSEGGACKLQTVSCFAYVDRFPRIVANTTSLKHRPIYQSISGGIECTALAFGPLISGAVAHAISWRASIYIIIPVGVAIILSVFFFVNDIERPENAGLSSCEKLQRVDVLGFLLFVPLTICLILGLQWAGTEYAWDSWRIILLFVLSGFLIFDFLAAEFKRGDNSMFPLNLLRQRSVALGTALIFCNSAVLFVTACYVSIIMFLQSPSHIILTPASCQFTSKPFVTPVRLSQVSCTCPQPLLLHSQSYSLAL